MSLESPLSNCLHDSKDLLNIPFPLHSPSHLKPFLSLPRSNFRRVFLRASLLEGQKGCIRSVGKNSWSLEFSLTWLQVTFFHSDLEKLPHTWLALIGAGSLCAWGWAKSLSWRSMELRTNIPPFSSTSLPENLKSTLNNKRKSLEVWDGRKQLC